jgi:hypothetical protein
MFNIFKVANKTLVSKDKDDDTGKIVTHIQFKIPNQKIYWNYAILYICVFTFGLSSSSFPSIVKKIEKEFDIHEKKVGLLSTMHYVGSLVGGLFMIVAMKLNIRKRILICSALGNMVCTFAISTASSYYLLFCIRFFNGFFVVMTVIMIPVWVDQFIPSSKKSIFMGINHTQSVASSIIGFIMTSNISRVIEWRYSWLIQGSLIFIVFCLILPMDAIIFCRTIKRLDDNGLFELSIAEVSHEDRQTLDTNSTTNYQTIKNDESIDIKNSNKINVSNSLDESSNNINERLVDSDSDSSYSIGSNTVKEQPIELTNFQIFCLLIKNAVS